MGHNHSNRVILLCNSISCQLLISPVIKMLRAVRRPCPVSTMSALEDGDMDTFGPELPAMFDGVKLAAMAAVLYIIVRCLNLNSTAAPPEITYQDTPLSRYLLKSCPMLTKE